DAEIQVGGELTIHLHIGDDQHIDAKCDVVWCRHNPPTSKLKRTVGFRFKGVDDATMELIHDIVYKRIEEEAARKTFLDERAIQRLIHGSKPPGAPSWTRRAAPLSSRCSRSRRADRRRTR